MLYDSLLVSHSSFLDSILISYVYDNCSILMRKDLWAGLIAFVDTHNSL